MDGAGGRGSVRATVAANLKGRGRRGRRFAPGFRCGGKRNGRALRGRARFGVAGDWLKRRKSASLLRQTAEKVVGAGAGLADNRLQLVLGG